MTSGWHKSSYSGAQGECVEVNEAAAPEAVLVRDTQNRDQGCLSFPGGEWSAFLGATFSR
ncbi:DUF397 domain-containing protein [Nocardiopsis sp. N85]|nr:DUF397 domain-containing protein [Nocardiopsis sp. N85]MDE3721431.1 DUF397 domain-containing protein [Nocardiopsis sp. N85]